MSALALFLCVTSTAAVHTSATQPDEFTENVYGKVMVEPRPLQFVDADGEVGNHLGVYMQDCDGELAHLQTYSFLSFSFNFGSFPWPAASCNRRCADHGSNTIVSLRGDDGSYAIDGVYAFDDNNYIYMLLVKSTRFAGFPYVFRDFQNDSISFIVFKSTFAVFQGVRRLRVFQIFFPDFPPSDEKTDDLFIVFRQVWLFFRRTGIFEKFPVFRFRDFP